MMDHVENYLKWLKENMTQCEIEKGLIEVTTPFLDRHNDYTQVYIQKLSDEMYRIHDWGYILSDLAMSGVEFTTEKRKKILTQTLKRRGVSLNGEEMYIECSKSDLPYAQHRLVQSMLDVNDMFYLASPTIHSLFTEDVKSFFDTHEIYYSRDIAVVGKSGLSHSFPFVLQRNKHNPERFIQLMNAPSRANAERYMFAWNDVQALRNDPENPIALYILINDLKNINATWLNGMETYDITPVLWSKREGQLAKFA